MGDEREWRLQMGWVRRLGNLRVLVANARSARCFGIDPRTVRKMLQLLSVTHFEVMSGHQALPVRPKTDATFIGKSTVSWN